MKFLPLLLGCTLLVLGSSCASLPRGEAEAIALNRANDIHHMANFADRYSQLSGHGVHEARWRKQVEGHFHDRDFAGVVWLYSDFVTDSCDNTSLEMERRDLIVTKHGRHYNGDTTTRLESGRSVDISGSEEPVIINRTEVIHLEKVHHRYSYRFSLRSHGTYLIYYFLGPEVGSH